jgi:hypothetical protein
MKPTKQTSAEQALDESVFVLSLKTATAEALRPLLLPSRAAIGKINISTAP